MATKQAGIILRHIRKMLTAYEAEQLSDRELLRRFAQERDETAFAIYMICSVAPRSG